MVEACKSKIRSGMWAGGNCGRDVVPGFDMCWFHANVEEMAAKIAELTNARDDAQSLAVGWKKAWEAKEAVLLTEQGRRVEAQEALSDLQRSIASALFGAARDDERVPVERVSGAMIDALVAGDEMRLRRMSDDGRWIVADAEAFLREEDRRDD